MDLAQWLDEKAFGPQQPSARARGYVYVRSEYPHAIATLNDAIARAEAAGFLGSDVLGSGRAFHLQVRKAAGAYVCGEETALLESLVRQARTNTSIADPISRVAIVIHAA